MLQYYTCRNAVFVYAVRVTCVVGMHVMWVVLQTGQQCCMWMQAMHGEVKYQDDIIGRVDDKVVKQNDNIRGLSDQARKDHRLGYTRR